MGSNSLAIFIKTDTAAYTHEQLAFDLFGATKEYQLSEQTLNYYNFIRITFHDSLIEIHHADFVENFLKNRNEKEVQTINLSLIHI